MDTTPPLSVTTARALNKGYASALLGVLFWSTTAIFISYLVTRYPLAPLTLAFWRDLFTTAALTAALGLTRRSRLRIEPRHRLFLIGYGVSLASLNILWTTSVALNGAAASTVLVYSSPAFTAIVARWLFGERLTPARLAAIAASLIGCILVSGAYTPGAWAVNAQGIVVGIASGLGFTFYSTMGKVSARRGINSWTATLAAFAVATCIVFLTQNGDSLFTLGGAFDGWAILFILATIPTLGGFGLYTVSLGGLPAGTANLIATLEPVLTAIMAFVLLGESFDGAQLAGGLLILASVVSLRISR